jgi:predicted RNase H-like HicB family nuclease
MRAPRVSIGDRERWATKICPLVFNAVSGRFADMASTFTAITKKDGEWWIGWIEEVPGVNAQEETKEQLISSLREILSEALEFNRSEARQAAEDNFTEELVTV